MQIVRRNTREIDTGNLFVIEKFKKGSDASTPRFVGKEKIRETDAG